MSILATFRDAARQANGGPIPVMVYEDQGIIMFSVRNQLFGIHPESQRIMTHGEMFAATRQLPDPNPGGVPPAADDTPPAQSLSVTGFNPFASMGDTEL